MIFSLFGRKPKRKDPPTGTRTPREPAPVRSSGLTAKIDAIESEMIKNGPATQSNPVTLTVASRTLVQQTGVAGKVVVPSSQARTAITDPPLTTRGTSTSRDPLGGPASRVNAGVPTRAAEATPESPAPVAAGGALDASAIEISGSQMPPACEEAAVLFSNGQNAEARVVLLQAIDDASLGVHQRQAWMMLFDLYQGTGQRDAFDALAMQFSERFESSPPSWDPTLAGSPEESSAASAGPIVVGLPALLDAEAVKALEQIRRAAERGRPVDLDARPIRQIDPLGADLLRRTLSTLNDRQARVHLLGATELLALADAAVRTGRRDDSDAVWLLLLELLRLLGQQQVFEDRAIDYCVTYEVSPPSWEPPSATFSTGAVASPRKAAERASSEPVLIASGAGLELIGDLEGRSAEVIAALRQLAEARNDLYLECRRLRRLDFGAAGDLLNEIVALRAAGKRLRMGGVSPLVGALLSVMGIPDLIEVKQRAY
ncbi:MAG: STAS domain-containing protein [Burkholderiaceae bacterium]